MTFNKQLTTNSTLSHLKHFNYHFLIKDCKRLHEELQSFSSLSWCMYSFRIGFTLLKQRTTLSWNNEKWKHVNCTSMPMSSHIHSHILVTLFTSTPGHQWLLCVPSCYHYLIRYYKHTLKSITDSLQWNNMYMFTQKTKD